jgi:hypothetical protein
MVFIIIQLSINAQKKIKTHDRGPSGRSSHNSHVMVIRVMAA